MPRRFSDKADEARLTRGWGGIVDLNENHVPVAGGGYRYPG
jgi:hypothetical protein